MSYGASSALADQDQHKVSVVAGTDWLAQPGSGTMPWRSSQARASASTFLPTIVTRQLSKIRSSVVSRADTASSASLLRTRTALVSRGGRCLAG